MFVPEAFLALIMTMTSAVCWGSWANTYKLTKNYRFELFYWDYAVGIFAISIFWAFTLGSMGSVSPGFLENMGAAGSRNMMYAMIGGAIFNVANLLLVAGIAMAGLAVAFPVSIGIALAVGVILSYLREPKGNPMLLAVGVALAIAAILMDGKAYANLPSAGRAVSRKSLIVCLVSGVLMGCFAPFVAEALNAGKEQGQALTPYSIAVLFTLGSFLCCFVVNVFFMRKPLVGDPVDFSGFFQARAGDHLLGLLGGFIWGTGMVFNFVAGSKVGVAISYAIGQSAPMVAALWGVFVWKEFAGAGGRAKIYLLFMFVFYILAVTVISQAS